MTAAATKVAPKLAPLTGVEPLEKKIATWKEGLNTWTVSILHRTRYVGLATAIIGGLGTMIMTGVFLATTFPVAVPIAFAVISVAGLAVYLAVKVVPAIRAFDRAKSTDLDQISDEQKPVEALKVYINALTRGACNKYPEIPKENPLVGLVNTKLKEFEEVGVEKTVVSLFLAKTMEKALKAVLDPAKGKEEVEKRDEKVKKYTLAYTACFDHFVGGANDAEKEEAAKKLFGQEGMLAYYERMTVLRENIGTMAFYCSKIKETTVSVEDLLRKIDYLGAIIKMVPADVEAAERKQLIHTLMLVDEIESGTLAEGIRVGLAQIRAGQKEELRKAVIEAFASGDSSTAEKALKAYDKIVGSQYLASNWFYGTERVSDILGDDRLPYWVLGLVMQARVLHPEPLLGATPLERIVGPLVTCLASAKEEGPRREDSLKIISLFLENSSPTIGKVEEATEAKIQEIVEVHVFKNDIENFFKMEETKV